MLSLKSTTLVISDVHLKATRPAVAERFFSFIERVAQHANSLIILGDLFDYWAGDDDLSDEFNLKVAKSLRSLSKAGVNTFLMVGNRDFLIGEAFARQAAIGILPDPSVISLDGVKTLLSHGDMYCTDDKEYQLFRSQVRSAEWQRDFLAKSLTERKNIIDQMRQQSKARRQQQTQKLQVVNDREVARKLQSHSAAIMIHGHIHFQKLHLGAIEDFQFERWVLGQWHDYQGEALMCDAGGRLFVDLCDSHETVPAATA